MMDIDRTAPLVVELHRTVHAPLETIWRLHTETDSWPAWNDGIDTAVPHGPLAPGASFDWTAAGLDIHSTVAEMTPMRRIVWGGPAHGITGIHVWEFEETAEGVQVSTRESCAGAPVDAVPQATHLALEESLQAWLNVLKTTAENRS
ncbi:SRPBCC family protein [Streptomyces sp. WI03-5b]|uniref:SRPBCC family protein n=1 Tax=Streptomyces sp. WI03-5b TaxID=462946 RepID=UPI0029BD43A6|nr:SRPBCC family protein [Streptomyces sp. WI03-5b]MDX2624930.1 SRPBCC family protein [Streptomyces sp. WI03-5b]